MGQKLTSTIDGLEIIPLKKIDGPKGQVLHVLKRSDPFFSPPEEVYISVTNPGDIKGWKLHKLMQQNFTVPVGAVKFVFFDDRTDSPTRGKTFEITIGLENYVRLHVPPQIWYSFKTVSKVSSHILNCTSIQHQPEETITVDLDSPTIPYQWE